MAEATNSKVLASLITNKGGEIELVEDTTYVISSNMVSRRSCDIIGPKDKGAILKIANRVRWAENVPMMRFNSVKGLSFENITFDGNFANSGKSRGDGFQTFVRAVNSSDIVIKNCHLHDNAGDGFRLDTCTDVDVSGCNVSKLGHEFIYAIYGCSDMQFHDNDVLNYCNSAFRLDSSAYDVDIYKNTIHSIVERGSTGPGIQLSKGRFEGIHIDSNTIHTENGSGIWISGDRAPCVDCQITNNTFENVGNYLNGSGTYNGYSNAGISGAGMDGLIIENNTFENIDVGYAVVMNEATHAVSGKYEWIFNNNTLKNCKHGFRVSNTRGSITGVDNTFTNVLKLKCENVDNINVSEKVIEPVDNSDTQNEVTKMGQFKFTINATCEDGRKYYNTATAQVTSVKANGTGKKISGYMRMLDVDTGEQIEVPFETVLQKGLF